MSDERERLVRALDDAEDELDNAGMELDATVARYSEESALSRLRDAQRALARYDATHPTERAE